MKAIDTIIEWAREHNRLDLENEITLLKSKQTELNRAKRIGIITNSEATVKQTKITYSVLQTLEDKNLCHSVPVLSQAESIGFGPNRPESKKPIFGGILYGIPPKMQEKNIHRCIIRVALDKNKLKKDLPTYIEKTVVKDNIRIGKEMSVTFSSSDYFLISAINAEEQLIDEYDYTEWNFDVKPLAIGKFPLTFTISIILENGIKQIVLTESIIVGIEPTSSGMIWKLEDFEGNNNGSDITKFSSRIKVLMLTANPADRAELGLNEEHSVILEKLQEKQTQFHIIRKRAVSRSEFKEFTQKGKPDILHFSGHGEDGKYSGIVVQNENKNGEELIPTLGLKALFKFLKKRFQIKVVLLNACHTHEQAATIGQYVDYVIGTNVAIGDKAARAFSSGFYFQLAEDNPIDIENAFDSGRTEAVLGGAEEENFVIYKNGVLIKIA